MKMKDVLSEELDLISLSGSEEREIEKLSKDFIGKIKKIHEGVFIGGSLAKGTMIKSDVQDVDVFVVFEHESESENLGRILKKAGFDAGVVHGSRDYFKVKKNEVVFEVIPVVDVDSPADAANVTDVSLKHVDWVKKQIRKDKKLKDEIKLAKAFCTGNDVYGAESYIQGFSGYALEVLVCYFGSFEKFLKQIKKQGRKGKIILDPEKHFKNKKEVLREMNGSKLLSPVVLVDPTYKSRNVTAGLSGESFSRFLDVVEKFLRKPDLSFFEKKKLDIEGMKKKAKGNGFVFLNLEFETDRQAGDIAGTKMKKFYNFFIDELNRRQQKVVESEFVYSGEQKAEGYFVLDLFDEIEIEGPEIVLKDAVKGFKRMHDDVYKKGERIYAKEDFDIEEVFNFLRDLQEDMGVKLKVKEMIK